MIDFLKIETRVFDSEFEPTRPEPPPEPDIKNFVASTISPRKLARLQSEPYTKNRTLYRLESDPERTLKVVANEGGTVSIYGSIRQYALGECSPNDLTKAQFIEALETIESEIGAYAFLTKSHLKQLEVGWQFEQPELNELIRHTLSFSGFGDGVTIRHDNTEAKRGNSTVKMKIYDRSNYTKKRVKTATGKCKCIDYPADQLRTEMRLHGSAIDRLIHISSPADIVQHWSEIAGYVAGRLSQTTFNEVSELKPSRSGDLQDATFAALATCMTEDEYKDVLHKFYLSSTDHRRGLKMYRQATHHVRNLVAELAANFRGQLEGRRAAS